MCGRVIFETYFRMYQHLTKVHICHAHFGAFSFLVSVVFHLIIKYLCQYLLCELVTAPCPICTRYFGTSLFSWINNRFWRNYQGWNWIFQGTWEIKSLYHCRKFHWILFPSRRVFVHSCHAEDGYGQMSRNANAITEYWHNIRSTKFRCFLFWFKSLGLWLWFNVNFIYYPQCTTLKRFENMKNDSAIWNFFISGPRARVSHI